METDTFSHYRVLRREDGRLWELRRGTTATTYRAVDTKTGQPVELRVIGAKALTDLRERSRFVSEVQAAASWRHPHAASVYPLGSDAHGYFVPTEAVDGESIAELVERRGRLPTREALVIAAQVAGALGAAARHGLVHAGIAPAKLILVRPSDSTSGEPPLVKVLGFGTSSVATAGPPTYSSPEQVSERLLDPRSDLYSLGVTLWYMLAGRPPFVGSAERVGAQHRRDEPPWSDLGDTPEVACNLLRHLLQKNPDGRPRDAAAVQDEIATIIVALDSPLAIDPGPAGAGTTLPAVGQSATPPGKLAAAAVSASPCVAGEYGNHSSSTGDVLAGRFVLVERVAEGNSGTVFRARDAQHGHARVAVKLFRPKLGLDEEAMEPVEDDWQRLRAAPHPNLIAVIAVGGAAGKWFVAEEWVGGGSLLAVLRRHGQLDVGETLGVLEAAANAAAHANAHGLRGLDLSAQSILLVSGSAAIPKTGEPAKAPKTDTALVIKIRAVKVDPDAIRIPPEAAGMTMVPSGNNNPGLLRNLKGAADPASYCPVLASLAYELLSGISAGVASRDGRPLPPLAAVPEEANHLLRQAIAGPADHRDEREFYHSFARACGVRAHEKQAVP